MEIYPLLAQYRTSQEVQIQIEADALSIVSGTLCVRHLDELVRQIPIGAFFGAAVVSIGSFNTPFSGFGVSVALSDGEQRYCLSTAFDVVSDPHRSLRYGFVSDFEEKDRDNGAVEWMRKYHINLVQFYDWSYRHDDLVCMEPHYVDMMGKHISGEVVRAKIRQAKSLGMLPMAYGAVYAASKPFFEAHPDWAFYTADGKPFVFIDTFYIMNIARNSPWRQHLYRQYLRAMQLFGFSGIHMDTYGFPKSAFSKLGGTKARVALEREFPALISDCRAEAESEGVDPVLVFNNVGNWPVRETAAAAQDAVYIEVWNPYERYHHIAQVIREARHWAKDSKPIILAAYLKPFRLEGMDEALEAAKLLMAAIVSHGAYHLLLGENGAALTQGYYSDYTRLSARAAEELRRYYDFMIRYLELFYDPALEDVSMTHCGGDNEEYRCLSHEISLYGEPNKVWLTIHESAQRKVLSLVNLCGNRDDRWNEGKCAPLVQHELSFAVHVDGQVKRIFCTSPDFGGETQALAFSEGTDARGKLVRFTLPELENWTVLSIECEE